MSANVNGKSSDDENHGLAKSELENSTEGKPNLKSQISLVDLERIVADTLKVVEQADEPDDDGDVDDPELLKELSEIIEPASNQHQVDEVLPTAVAGEIPALLKQRIEMYKLAEENASSANECSRVRRLCRGLSTLETMLKDSLAGKAINVEDIPPEVVVTKKDSVPVENK
ncbi:Coiled-coil and C2 domain-containing protein 1-like [Pseudolycoriella hygida]|uniref:Coiled-coil and C2 domain-containing protein 1-like n=1 Tax=Pseudolycoriella hygida TaxID=35572 RepID=A0A9Q0SA52_9DIPT|nr:Coiled-coil and C2 domain-containing protein 1-like [Pseudolycoriella hygida]